MEDAESLEDWDSEDSGSVELDLEVSDPDDSEDMEDRKDSEPRGGLRISRRTPAQRTRGLGIKRKVLGLGGIEKTRKDRRNSMDSKDSKRWERPGGLVRPQR